MDSGNIKYNVATGLIWKYAERITAQLVSLLIAILLARFLSPRDYGAVALAMIFITFANVFVSCGFGSALVQKKDADNIDFSTIFYLGLLISIIIYIVLFLASPLISRFYDLPILCPVLRVLGIRLIIASVNSVQQAYVSKQMKFKLFFWSTLFGTIVSGFVGVYLAYKNYGVWALVAQYLTNTIIDTIVLFFTMHWYPTFDCSLKRAKVLFGYGWKMLASGLLETTYNQIRNLIIGTLYTMEDLAYYNQGDRYPSVIVTNINASIDAVLFPALSKYQSDKNKVKNITRRALQVSSYIMWPMMIGLAVCSKPLICLLLTEKWLPVVPYLMIFCFTYGLWPIHTANLQAISALGRSDIFLKLEIIKKVYGVIILLVTMKISPFAMAISLIFQGILSSFVNAYPNIKLLDYKIGEQLKDVLPPFIISSIMGVLVYCFSFLSLSNIKLLILQVLFGIIIYILLSIITKQEAFIYLLHSIKEVKKDG